MRHYHVIAEIHKTGEIVWFTDRPVSHAEGCAILRKLTRYPWRSERLQEVDPATIRDLQGAAYVVR